MHKVISDITGATGMAVIWKIVAGERDPQALAALKVPRIKSSTTEIAQALTGDYRAEHLFVLQQELAVYEIYQQQILACDLRFAATLRYRQIEKLSIEI
jgi:transposase